MNGESRGRVLLSIGDPNGIGPEIAVRAAGELRCDPALAPVLVGDRFVIERQPAATRLTVRDYSSGAPPRPDALDVLDVPALAKQEWQPGVISAAAGAATVAYLTAAVDLVRKREARAIVACPHSETAVNLAGIAFRGYPPLLAELAGAPADEVFLMLIGAGLRIVHVTLHERLEAALRRLTPDLVGSACMAAHEALVSMGIATPRIGVFGINPHAGENGLFGAEDERITAPAVAGLRDEGLDVDGPTGADVLLAARRHDGYVAMYHDQGHVPVKLLAGRDSSAVTIGSGMVFSSVGHGAAFDIAGAGVADPSAVLGAVRLVGGATVPAANPVTQRGPR